MEIFSIVLKQRLQVLEEVLKVVDNNTLRGKSDGLKNNYLNTFQINGFREKWSFNDTLICF